MKSIPLIKITSSIRAFANWNIGMNSWHGPHQDAKKSIKTGLSCCCMYLYWFSRDLTITHVIRFIFQQNKIGLKPFLVEVDNHSSISNWLFCLDIIWQKMKECIRISPLIVELYQIWVYFQFENFVRYFNNVSDNLDR